MNAFLNVTYIIDFINYFFLLACNNIQIKHLFFVFNSYSDIHEGRRMLSKNNPTFTPNLVFRLWQLLNEWLMIGLKKDQCNNGVVGSGEMNTWCRLHPYFTFIRLFEQFLLPSLSHVQKTCFFHNNHKIDQSEPFLEWVARHSLVLSQNQNQNLANSYVNGSSQMPNIFLLS